MREYGEIDSASGLGPNGHACWAFEGEGDFDAATLEYLEDGRRFGQRLVYVGDEPVAAQRERLDPLGDVGGLIDSGELQLFTLEELYAVGRPVDPSLQLRRYQFATQRALADGYRGLRVAAEATALVVDPATRDAHARWENVLDRYMTSNPASVLCGYDRQAIPEDFLSDLSSLHPVACRLSHPTPFHVFEDGGSLCLTGEVDFFSVARLERVVEIALGAGEEVVLDLGRLEFIDHHGLRALAEQTRGLREDGTLSVRNVPPAVDKLCRLLEMSPLR